MNDDFEAEIHKMARAFEGLRERKKKPVRERKQNRGTHHEEKLSAHERASNESPNITMAS